MTLAATYGQEPWGASLAAVQSGRTYDQGARGQGRKHRAEIVESAHPDAQLLLEG